MLGEDDFREPQILESPHFGDFQLLNSLFGVSGGHSPTCFPQTSLAEIRLLAASVENAPLAAEAPKAARAGLYSDIALKSECQKICQKEYQSYIHPICICIYIYIHTV